MEKISTKIETTLAALILIIVIGLFAKYHEPKSENSNSDVISPITSQ